MFSKESLNNPDPSIAHCHCATITQTLVGDLLVCWYGYPEKETQGAVLFLARRRPHRSKFDKPKRILPTLTASLGNPVLFCDHSGRVHLLFTSLRGSYWDSAVIGSCHSDDAGDTWSTPEMLGVPEGTMVRYPPMARGNEYFLLPAYDEKTNQTVMLTAGPDAQGWFAVQHFEDSPSIQGSITRQGDKDMTMILRPGGDERICYRSFSIDDGKSWSRVMKTTLPNPLSGVAAIQMGDRLCAIYNHTTEHQRFPLSFSHSANRGVSWSEPVHIDTTEQEVSYPSFIVDDKGVAHGVYTFGRRRIQYVTFDQSWWLQ